MQYKATTIEEYINQIDISKKSAFFKLFELTRQNLPMGFESGFYYRMPTFFVPHSIYPAGYHCNPKQPLPFIAIAAQKNFLAFYHMGLYVNPDLMLWFVNEYVKLTGKKPDIGKSCFRMKISDDIPFELIAELCQKITVDDWIKIYESQIKKK